MGYLEGPQTEISLGKKHSYALPGPPDAGPVSSAPTCKPPRQCWGNRVGCAMQKLCLAQGRISAISSPPPQILAEIQDGSIVRHRHLATP